MKRILYVAVMMAVALSALSSCMVYGDDDYRWNTYDLRGSEYILYPDNVMKRCVCGPLEMLDYVINITDTLSAAGIPVHEGMYVISDKSGLRIGTISCEVNADRDTVWSYGGTSYIVNRFPAPGADWKVILKENSPAEGETGRYWYDSVLEARNMTDEKPGAVRHCYEISFSGVRHEDSRYSLEFGSSAMKIRWDNPESYPNASMSVTGTLALSFRKDGHEKDWLKAEYSSGVISYVKSF